MANRSYSEKTIKILFGNCGRQCAHPDCTNPIIESATDYSDDAVVGQICHIYAASDNGPRGKTGLTDDEKNSPENLILLCGHHHPVVDKQHETYPAPLLQKWKREHEAKYQPATAEAIRLQEKTQQLAYTAGLTDQEIEAEVRRIRVARNMVGYPTIDRAKALAAAVERKEFAGGSSEVRANALAFCARMLSRGENLAQAKELLTKSKELGDAPEAVFANAFIVAAEVGSGAALALLAPMNTPEARSVMLRIVSNEKGPQGSLDWAKAAGLTFSSFDSEGKLILLMNEEMTGQWDDAYAHAQALQPADFEATPVLNYAAANALVAHVIPEPMRAAAIFQMAVGAQQIPMADDDQSLKDRKRAGDLYDKQIELALANELPDTAKYASELVLGLRLRDPDLRDDALNDLRERLRDEDQALRYAPLAIQFGIKLDLEALERRVNERVALTGKGAIDEAVARLTLALTKPSAAEAVEYLSAHRQQLNEFFDPGAILSLEVELLCQSGQVESAKAALAQAAAMESARRDRLERIIQEAEGADPASSRRKLYEKTGDLIDLLNLVAFLEQQKSWQDLVPLVEVLFDRTRSAENALRVVNAMNNTGDYKRLLQFLLSNQEIIEREDDLRSALAWALYRDGQFTAASQALAPLQKNRDHPNDRALFVNLAIGSGQWDSLVGHTTDEWQKRENRTPKELLLAGQLAQAVNAPHARDLIVAATERAPDDPKILAPAYFQASSSGWEKEAIVSAWLLKAAEKSGDQGPLKSITMKELIELKPNWDKRHEEICTALDEALVTVSAAAFALGQSMIDLGLLRPSANRNETDARRRSVVYAFSGARPSIVAADPKRVALDLTAIFTFAQLGLLAKVVDQYDCVLIPDQLLSWLFEERQRVSFHQPSRLKDAHFLKRLIAGEKLEIFTSKGQAPPTLVRDVGYDLAAMLATAEQSGGNSYVVRSAPVSRLGSLMEEEADLQAYKTCLCSCQAVVEALRLKGTITATEEKNALSYLKLHEKRWDGEPRIQDGATLYLDDLSTTYLRTVGLLDKLQPAGFTALVTKSLSAQDNQLITYESVSEQQLTTIENIRAILAKGLTDGRVETIPSPEQDGENARLKAQLNFLATDKAVDAFVIDDRFVNRYLHMDQGGRRTPILTSLDLVNHLVRSAAVSVEEEYEHRTNLRRSGYSFVPITEQELVDHLMAAPLVEGVLMETAELRAIREAVLQLRLNNLLQTPHELTWLQNYTLALIRATRAHWKRSADSEEAKARCEWLVPHFNSCGWAAIAQKGATALFVQTSYAAALHGLAFIPDVSDRTAAEPYHLWLDERLLLAIKETEPEIFNQIIATARAVLRENIEDIVRQVPDVE